MSGSIKFLILIATMGALAGCVAARRDMHTYEQAHRTATGGMCPQACANDTSAADYSSVGFVDNGP